MDVHVVVLRTDRARGTLNVGINAGAVSIVLSSGQGALFPSPTDPDYFWVVLEQGTLYPSTQREIVKCTSRSGDTLTVVRAQQGTTAQAFNAGDRVELRITQDVLSSAYARVVEAQMDSRLTEQIGGAGAGGVATDDPWGLLGEGGGGVNSVLATTSQLLGQSSNTYQNSSGIGVHGAAADAVFRGSAANVGGFHFDAKLGMFVNNASTRMFVGLVDASGTPSTYFVNSGNPSAQTGNSMVALGFDDTSLTSDNLKVFTNAGTVGTPTTVTVTDTGISRASVLTDIIYLMIHADANASSVRVLVKDLVTGNGIDQAFSSNIPATTTGLIWHFETKGNGGANTARIVYCLMRGWPFARPMYGA